jgi:hypothetical protein
MNSRLCFAAAVSGVAEGEHPEKKISNAIIAEGTAKALNFGMNFILV